MKKLSIAAIVLASIAVVGQIFVFATHKEDSNDTYRKALQSDYRVYAPVLPDSIDFCGESVPTDVFYVREALERELMVNMYWQSNMLQCMKRAGRYFPIIEPILKRNGVPADFRFLCVIESGLTNATSPAKAQGFWQFIKATGQRYGLEITDEVDMRNDITASTEAACRYLKSLHARFGSWTAAAAAYNCGEAGLSSRMTRQDATSYYHTYLNRETTRYVYRILAVKLIMEHPKDYGFYLRQRDLYSPVPTTEVELTGQNVDLYSFARTRGTSYKMLRELNPWLQTDKLVNKQNRTYKVALPAPSHGGLSRLLHPDQGSAIVEHL